MVGGVCRPPRDPFGDNLYKSREVLAYPFELVTAGDKSRLVRGGDPACPLTKGVLMGRYVPNPSKFNFWSNLSTAEKDRFTSKNPANIRPNVVRFFEHAASGLVCITGAPGTGKTWLMAFLAIVRSVAGKKLSCHAPTNAATSVFFNRYVSILENNSWHDDYLAIRHYGAHLEVAMVVKFLLARHTEEQWKTDPQYRSYGASEDADIGQWAPEGSAAAAALYVMGKISNVKCGSRVLRNMRHNKVVEWLLDLIEIAVADHLAPGVEPQGNFLPDDFKNDLEAEDTRHDDQASSNQPDGAPQCHFNKEDILHRLEGRSLGGLIRELML